MSTKSVFEKESHFAAKFYNTDLVLGCDTVCVPVSFW